VPRCLGILIALEAGAGWRSGLDGGGMRQRYGGQDGGDRAENKNTDG
jgi:hypothetical protein